MKNIQHIHEVLHILGQNEQPFTVDELYTELKERYGDDVHFSNCADNDFPIQEVVPFLLSKQKISLSEDKIIPIMLSCNH